MGLNNIEVKRVNRNNLLRYMLKSGQISKSGAASVLHLSIPTVTQCLNDLVKMGLACEDGALQSIGGRKSIGYRCIKDAKVAIGVDITRRHVNIVAIDLAMDLLYFKRVNMKLENNGASYEKLKKLIVQSIEESKIDEDAILGLGVSIPAIVDESGKKIYAMHEEFEVSYHLYDIIQAWFPYPVFLQNDADSAGRAEFRIQNLTGNVVYYYFAPSVGGAVIIDGKPFYGINRRTGEFGHMILYPGGRECFCGRRGCVNAYCSTYLLSDCTDGNLEEFFRLLECGEEKYVKIWEEYMDSISLALHNLITAFDMNIIIGGYLGKHIEPYMDILEEKIKKLDTYLSDIRFIIPAKLKYEASAMGAAGIFIEKYLAEI